MPIRISSLNRKLLRDRAAMQAQALGAFEQLGRDLGEARNPHQHHQGVDRRQGPPVGGVFATGAVGGDDGEGRRHAAMGDRNAGDRGYAHRAGHTRHHLPAHAGGGTGGGLLTAASEDEGVAALEPHHHPAGPRALDEQRLDLLLRQRVMTRPLAHVDALGRGRGRSRGGRPDRGRARA